jgi:hypothetical protein
MHGEWERQCQRQNKSLCGGMLGGFWAWAILNAEGTFDASTTGCGHSGGPVLDLSGPWGGASHCNVDGFWTNSNGDFDITSETDTCSNSPSHGQPQTTTYDYGHPGPRHRSPSDSGPLLLPSSTGSQHRDNGCIHRTISSEEPSGVFRDPSFFVKVHALSFGVTTITSQIYFGCLEAHTSISLSTRSRRPSDSILALSSTTSSEGFRLIRLNFDQVFYEGPPYVSAVGTCIYLQERHSSRNNRRSGVRPHHHQQRRISSVHRNLVVDRFHQ